MSQLFNLQPSYYLCSYFLLEITIVSVNSVSVFTPYSSDREKPFSIFFCIKRLSFPNYLRNSCSKDDAVIAGHSVEKCRGAIYLSICFLFKFFN